jgi:hypothetical protein
MADSQESGIGAQSLAAGGQRSFQNADQLSRPWISVAAQRLRLC